MAFKAVPEECDESDKIKEPYHSETHDNRMVECLCWESLNIAKYAIRFKFALNAEALQGATSIQRYAMFHHGCRPYLMTVVHAFNTILTLLCLLIGGPVIDGPVIGGSGVNSLKQVIFYLAVIRLIHFIGDVKILASPGTQGYLGFRRMIASWPV